MIGASGRAGSVGGEILRNLIRHGYQGTIYPVNPKHREVEGLHCYRDVDELPETDMAVVAVPRGFVHRVVEQCGIRGIRNLVIITAGFKEAGAGCALMLLGMLLSQLWRIRPAAFAEPGCPGERPGKKASPK